MVATFYSLALHMYKTLGGWPETIGTKEFPPELLSHADFAGQLFTLLFLAGVLVWPVAFILCAVIKKWRGGLYYTGIFALSCSVSFATMQLAPAEFVYWWWD